MNIDLDGKIALVGGARGALTTAICAALEANGAKTGGISVTEQAASTADGEPYVLVLISEGANGLPDADARCAVVHRLEAAAGEAREYIATLAHAA